MERLRDHGMKYNHPSDAISYVGLFHRKKSNGTSLGDMRRFFLQQGCCIPRCYLCHHWPVNKSAKKSRGKKKHQQKNLDEDFSCRN